MKTKITVICLVIAAAIASACSTNAEKKTTDKEMKTLVTYFSASGNTERAARKIAAATGADLMAIEPVQAYTAADLDWTDTTSRSTIEMKNPSQRPAVKPATRDIKEYDVVYIGFPIWWYTAPTVINSFIESNDLTGAILVPFATSGGSTIDRAQADLRQAYPNLRWADGRLVNRMSDKAIADWTSAVK